MAENWLFGILIQLKDEASEDVKALTGNLEKLGGQSRQSERELRNLSGGIRKVREVGIGLTAVGVGAAAALYSVIRPAMGLDASLRMAASAAGITGEKMSGMADDLMKKALQWSSATGISAEEVATAFTDVLRETKGLGPEFDSMIGSALRMSRTFGVGTAQAVNLLSGTMDVFGVKLTETARVADLLTRAATEGETGIDAMAETLRRIGPMALKAGFSMEDTAATIAVLTRSGRTGEEAGTALRQVFTRLIDPAPETTRALEMLGLSLQDSTGAMRPFGEIMDEMRAKLGALSPDVQSTTLTALAGNRAWQDLGVLMRQDSESVVALSGRLRESKGALAGSFAATQRGSEGTRSLTVAMDNLRKAIGAPLVKPFGALSAALARIISLFTRLFLTFPFLSKLIGIVLAVVAVVGILVGGILTLTTSLALLATRWLPLLTSGLTGFSANLRIVGSLVRTLAVGLWGAVKATVAWVAAQVRALALRAAQVAGMIAQTVATWASAIALKAAAIAQWLFNTALFACPIVWIVAGIMAIVGVVILLVKYWDAIVGAVKRAFEWIKNFVNKTRGLILLLLGPLGVLIFAIRAVVRNWEAIKDAAKAVATWIVGVFRSVVDWFKRNMKLIGTIALSALIGPFSLVVMYWKDLPKIFSKIVNWISGVWAKLYDRLPGPVKRVVDIVSSLFRRVADGVKAAIRSVWEIIRWVISQIPDTFLPESLERVKYGAGRKPAGAPVGGQMVVSAVAPATERAIPRPRVPRDPMAMPAFAAAGGGGGETTITIGAGAIQIHALRVDESVVRRMDYELGRLIRRRMERR